MALTAQSRSVWSARLNYWLMKAMVYGFLTNHDYEGDASQAKTVKIVSIGDVTINDYDGSDITVEDLATTSIDLTLDQQKYFAFKVDKTVAATTNIELVDPAAKKAAYALKDVIDKAIAALYSGADSTMLYGDDTTPKTVGLGTTDLKAYDAIVDLLVKLDEANVPAEGRYVIITPWIKGLLTKDSRFTTNPVILSNGLIQGQTISNAQIYMSNNVPNTSGAKYKILAGTKDAIAFANGIQELDVVDMEKNFAKMMKGLQVYGMKLLNAKAIAVGTFSKGTLA